MRKRLLAIGFVSLFCFVLFVGCADPVVLLAPDSKDTEAKAFKPQSGRANIYVYRTGAARNLPIFLDGENVGELSLGSYLLLTVPPGRYTLSGIYDSVIVNAEANKNYFAMVHGGFLEGVRVKLVDENEGQKGVWGSTHAENTLSYGQLETHKPSQPEKTFEFVLRTEPCSARVVVKQNGIEKEIGTTPYTFRVGLAGRYEYWPVQRRASASKEIIEQGYILYSNEPNLVTVRQIGLIYEELPILDLKAKLVAEGFEPQSVEREIKFELPCSPTNVENCVPDRTEIVVGLNRPTKPEYVVKVKIDSIPSGSDIYVLAVQGYLGEKLGTTPAEFEVGFANRRYPYTGRPNPLEWSIWRPNSEEGFITGIDEKTPSAQLNFVLLKDGYARQDVTHWMFHTPDTTKFEDIQKTITIPLKTHEEARQERMERIEQARTQLAAALKATELELKRAEISNQQELIRQQELISKYLNQLNTAFDRASTSSPGTIVVKNDPHYNREWQDAMAALGNILRPYSKISPIETEKNIQGLEGLGSLIDLDLMNR